MTTNDNSTPAAPATPAALALIANANARRAEAKLQEVQAALDKVTALWGRMTVAEIKTCLRVNLPLMTEEEGGQLKAMAEEAIATLRLADEANHEYKQAFRLSTPDGVEHAVASILSQETLDKEAAEVAKIKKAKEAADAAKKAWVSKVIADYGDTLTENQKRAMTAFLSAPSCKWTYNPTEEGRAALLRAVARAARATAALRKAAAAERALAEQAKAAAEAARAPLTHNMVKKAKK